MSAHAILETAFALHGRLRPYNKHLQWELARDALFAGRRRNIAMAIVPYLKQ
jgi:hypothetical protein